MCGYWREFIHGRRPHEDKITLNGSLVYYFDVWVGDQVGQEAILEMEFMVPAGIRLELADGTVCLLEEVRFHL